MPRAARSGTPLKYCSSLVTSNPSKNTIAGARPLARSGAAWTRIAGRLAPSYGTSTDSMRGRSMSAAASLKAATARR